MATWVLFFFYNSLYDNNFIDNYVVWVNLKVNQSVITQATFYIP